MIILIEGLYRVPAVAGNYDVGFGISCTRKQGVGVRLGFLAQDKACASAARTCLATEGRFLRDVSSPATCARRPSGGRTFAHAKTLSKRRGRSTPMGGCGSLPVPGAFFGFLAALESLQQRTRPRKYLHRKSIHSHPAACNSALQIKPYPSPHTHTKKTPPNKMTNTPYHPRRVGCWIPLEVWDPQSHQQPLKSIGVNTSVQYCPALHSA